MYNKLYCTLYMLLKEVKLAGLFFQENYPPCLLSNVLHTLQITPHCNMFITINFTLYKRIYFTLYNKLTEYCKIYFPVGFNQQLENL